MRSNKNNSIWESALYTQGGAETDWKEYNTQIQFTPQSAIYFNKDYASFQSPVADKLIIKKQDNSYQLITPTEYTGSLGWSLVQASNASQNFTTLTSQDSQPSKVKFSSDGTKMYMVGYTNRVVYQYTLSTPWNVSTASYASKSFSVNAQVGSSVTGLAFSPDGTKFFVNSGSNNRVYQYTMSTAWDITTATYSNKNSGTTFTTMTSGLAISLDGTKLYSIDNSGTLIKQYTMSTPWDVSTLTYSTKSLSTNLYGLSESSPQDIYVNSSGTAIFIIGDNSDDIWQIRLSTPFDLATANPNSFAILKFLQATMVSYTIDFNPDGSKMYVFISSSLGAVLGTYNIGYTKDTILYSGLGLESKDLYFGGQANGAYQCLVSSDGTKAYICNTAGTIIYQYSLSVPFDTSTSTYDSKTLTLYRSSTGYGLYMSPDGYYVYLQSGSNTIDQYMLKTPFDISTGVFTGYYTNSSYIPSGSGCVCISIDGTKMYIGNASSAIYQFTLSVPWMISSATYSGVKSLSYFGASSIWLSIDGKHLLLSSSSNSATYSYTLSTAWDITTATLVDSISNTGIGGTGYSIATVSSCGRYMYFYGTSASYPYLKRAQFFGLNNPSSYYYSLGLSEIPIAVYSAVPKTKVVGTINSTECVIKYSEYPISTYNTNSITLAYDNTIDSILSIGAAIKCNTSRNIDLTKAINTGKSISVSSYSNSCFGVHLSEDGTKMYVCGTGSTVVGQYNLSRPYDVSSAVFTNISISISTQDGLPQDLYFSTDGSKMYIIGDSNNEVYQYTLSTPWSLSTAVYASKSFSVASQTTAPVGVCFSYDGTKMYVNSSYNIYQYTLSTAWDVSTASYASKLLATNIALMYGLDISRDGTTILTCEYSGLLHQYTLDTPFDLSTGSYTSKTLSLGSSNSSVFISKSMPNLVYVLGYPYTVYQGLMNYPSVDVPATITNISVSGGQTTVTIDSNLYPYGVKIQSNKAYEVFDSITESGTDLIATSGKTIFTNGKRNLKIRVDGNLNDIVTAVTTNLWKL